jgi:hypothetical protein
VVGDGARIGEHAVLERCQIPAGAIIPPLTSGTGA